MKNYKESIVFEEPQKVLDETIELTPQHYFDSEKDTFSEDASSSEEEKPFEKRHMIKKRVWGWRVLGGAGVALVCWQTVDHVLQAIQTQNNLSIAWSAFWAGVAFMGLSVIGREFLSLYRLNERQGSQNEIQEIMDANGMGKAKSVCEQLSRKMGPEHTLTPGYDRWVHSLATTHNDKDVFELYEQIVIKEQDIIAQKLIRKHASEAALMVALSPLALVDMILVGWRNFRMLEQISNLYGVELGFFSKIKLTRLIFANMALAGATEAITDIGVDLLSVDLAGRLSARAAQGLGIGLVTARLGYKAMQLMRPLPYIRCPEPKLSDIRKQLLGRLDKE